MSAWIVSHLGVETPLHFTAFHPDWKMLDTPRTPPATLHRAREIALGNGLRYCYTGNVHDRDGQSTYCHACGHRLIGRDWYVLGSWGLRDEGCCEKCGTCCSGVFEEAPGDWGPKRMPLQIGD